MNETYPLFLECGRQLSPHFYSQRQLAEPDTDRMRDFVAGIAHDIVVVWPTSAEQTARSPIPQP